MLQFITRWSRVLVAHSQTISALHGGDKIISIHPTRRHRFAPRDPAWCHHRESGLSPVSAHSAARRKATESLHSIPSRLKVPPLCRLNPVSGPLGRAPPPTTTPTTPHTRLRSWSAA